jgi:hypothetical protein
MRVAISVIVAGATLVRLCHTAPQRRPWDRVPLKPFPPSPVGLHEPQCRAAAVGVYVLTAYHSPGAPAVTCRPRPAPAQCITTRRAIMAILRRVSPPSVLVIVLGRFVPPPNSGPNRAARCGHRLRIFPWSSADARREADASTSMARSRRGEFSSAVVGVDLDRISVPITVSPWTLASSIFGSGHHALDKSAGSAPTT